MYVNRKALYEAIRRSGKTQREISSQAAVSHWTVSHLSPYPKYGRMKYFTLSRLCDVIGKSQDAFVMDENAIISRLSELNELISAESITSENKAIFEHEKTTLNKILMKG